MSLLMIIGLLCIGVYGHLFNEDSGIQMLTEENFNSTVSSSNNTIHAIIFFLPS